MVEFNKNLIYQIDDIIEYNTENLKIIETNIKLFEEKFFIQTFIARIIKENMLITSDYNYLIQQFDITPICHK